jgi:signal transduction histidine kinase
MFQQSVSLRAQLLISFVILVVGTTVGLTFDAYRSSLVSLEADARRSATVAAHTRARALHRMLANRQRRADGFLAGARELCGEPTEQGRYAWALDCMAPMTDAFRAAEGASGATISYRGRRLIASGAQAPHEFPNLGTLARVMWTPRGPAYVMQAQSEGLVMIVLFGGNEVMQIFGDDSNLGQRGEVFLLNRDGRFLTPARYKPGGGPGTPPGAVDVEPVRTCASGAGEVLDIDYRGIRTLHAYQPVPSLEGACVDAHVNFEEALEPAERLRARLLGRGALFIVIGALFSLVASHRIAAPVQRLAAAARGLRSSLEEPIPVGGPSEVRALGYALRETAADVAGLVSREQSARRDAQSANKSKDQFLAAISHELRTPVTAILGWTRVVRSQQLPDTRLERALDVIERNAHAQSRLIEDLLDVSRIVAGQLRVTRETVLLAGVIERALEAIRPQADEKNILLQTAIEDRMLAVSGDAERLQQVVWNLVANAVKFTPAGGSVLVGLKRTGSNVQLSVRDNGAGIPKAFLPHVFEWFRQGDADHDRAPAGLGLGLGVVRQLVELHGGTVHAESEGQGYGARFVVVLPLDSSPALDDAATPPVAVLPASFDVH